MICEPFAAPYVLPGWVCCVCRHFSSWKTTLCWKCRHTRCLEAVKPVQEKARPWRSNSMWDLYAGNKAPR